MVKPISSNELKQCPQVYVARGLFEAVQKAWQIFRETRIELAERADECHRLRIIKAQDLTGLERRP